MKLKYLYPQACPVELTTAQLLASSDDYVGTGQDFDDPTFVSVDDFNDIF